MRRNSSSMQPFFLFADCAGKSPHKVSRIHVARGACPPHTHTQGGTRQEVRESKGEGEKKRGEEKKAVREIVGGAEHGGGLKR